MARAFCPDITVVIADFLPLEQVHQLTLVSKLFHSLFSDDSYWYRRYCELYSEEVLGEHGKPYDGTQCLSIGIMNIARQSRWAFERFVRTRVPKIDPLYLLDFDVHRPFHRANEAVFRAVHRDGAVPVALLSLREFVDLDRALTPCFFRHHHQVVSRQAPPRRPEVCYRKLLLVSLSDVIQNVA